MQKYDPTRRLRLQALLAASEALRRAAADFASALDDAPLPQAGLSVFTGNMEDVDVVDDVIDAVADRLGVAEDSDERRTVTTRKAARERLEHVARVSVLDVEDIIERLAEVVSAAATPALAEEERAALATYATTPATTPTTTPTKRGRR
jgi:hypothetical protein